MVRWLYILLAVAVVTASCAAKKKESNSLKTVELKAKDSLRSELIHVKSKGFSIDAVQKDSVYYDGLRLTGFTGTIRQDGTVEGTAEGVHQQRSGKKTEAAKSAGTTEVDSTHEIKTSVAEREEAKTEIKEKKSDRKSSQKGFLLIAAIAVVLIFLAVSMDEIKY